MSNADIIRTAIEFAAAVAVVLCFVFEKKLIKFETNIARFFKAVARTYRANKQQKLRYAYASANVQSRAPSDLEEDFEEVVAFTVINGGKSSERVA